MRLVEHVRQQQAMGGTVQIGLIVPKNYHVEALYNAMWLLLFTFERSASRFIQSSELTQLNTNTALRQPVSPLFKELLSAAKQCAGATSGLYNPFVLPAVQRTGYLASVTAVSNQAVHDVRTRRITTIDKLEIGTDWARIPYGTAIDLGGCGKGFIVDKLANQARQQGVVGGWIEASGDIFAWGYDTNGEQLRVAIQDQNDDKHESYVVVVPAHGCGIATSGTFTRPGATTKPGSHHIIDPSTGKPAQTDLRLATVVAETALMADVLASCAIIVGSESAPQYVHSHGARSWLLQYDKRIAVRDPIVQGSHIWAASREVQHA